MESIQTLIDIMESQKTLYTDLLSILNKEKEAAIQWDAKTTNELTKTKDTLVYKEKVINEAFVSCIRKIEKESGKEPLRVENIAHELAGDLREPMLALREELMQLTRKVNECNTSLKIIFKTNSAMIDGLFSRLGLGGRNTYGINKSYNTQRTSTICQTG